MEMLQARVINRDLSKQYLEILVYAKSGLGTFVTKAQSPILAPEIGDVITVGKTQDGSWIVIASGFYDGMLV